MYQNIKNVPIKNIGHITFQMKNEDKMIHFYTEIIGMRVLFTLNVWDLADTIRKYNGEEAVEWLKPFMNSGVEVPWIQYLKFSDGQFLELFHSLEDNYETLDNRSEYYGFQKVNYEVDDIEAMYDRICKAGVEIKQKIHTVVDGAKEFAVLDPDGNEIQFTQYGNSVIPLKKDSNRTFFSPVKYTTQVAWQIQNAEEMRKFYCEGLGLKIVYTFTFGDLCSYLEQSGVVNKNMLSDLKQIAELPWIDYVEVAPHQFIEFFYSPGEKRKETGDLRKFYGYQHICLEVADIHTAWNAVTSNGIQPYTQINMGCEGAYQFWMEDPDGNQIELMEYAPGAKQLLL